LKRKSPSKSVVTDVSDNVVFQNFILNGPIQESEQPPTKKLRLTKQNLLDLEESDAPSKLYN
jgi:hypothetical protein